MARKSVAFGQQAWLKASTVQALASDAGDARPAASAACLTES